jgi:undecaprenyl-diphosphatase
MSIWDAVLLGVIQGLTEFLPISSTAHLLVARQLLGHENKENAFTVVIQLGTLLAVFIYYRIEIARLIHGFLADVRAIRIGSNPDGLMAWLIILGTIPAVVVGFLFEGELKKNFFNLPSIGVVAIVFALLLALAEWWAHYRARTRSPRTENEIGWADALWVGLWQACALMPGGSRSGTTITAGLFAGLDRPIAARFSFLLSIPVILGAGLKSLYGEYHKLKHPEPGAATSLFASGDEVTALIVGTMVSAVVGYLSIAWLMHFLRRYSTAVFIVYRILFGVTILVALRLGFLS